MQSLNGMAGQSVRVDPRITELEQQVVSGFYEEEIPTFQQGAPTHELQSAVTAEEVTGYVAKITELYAQVAALTQERNDLETECAVHAACTKARLAALVEAQED